MERYVKVRKIGEGSFGKAILVKNKEDGIQYVVKEISISKMQPKERQEARKEVSVLSKMRHPNIVQYVESFEENGSLYIVMEYCEGGDLYARINAQRGMAFSEAKVLDWFVQICLALKHVHDRKILHRDIKTSNIFLTKSGAIKLGDFGIARVLNNTCELARTCIGTPYYLSPEICENKPYNNKSDVWALGCVLYEVLTLKHAFEAGNMKNLVLKIIRGSYPPVPPRYSYDLRSLVNQLFKRNPRDRPSVNSILRKPFIHRHTEKFLTPEQHEDEFSHTVLHHNRKPAKARPSSAAAAYRKPEAPKPRAAAVKSPVDPRAKQIAGVYGQSVAVKRPSSAASRYQRYADQQKKVQADLQKKKQNYLEAEKKRRLAIEKKQKEEIAQRQLDRAERIRAEQIRRARDNARHLNLKRSVEMFDPKKENDENKNPVQNPAPAKLPRPTSAPSQAQPQKYEKYYQYLNKLRQGDRKGAVDVAAPQLAQVKQAWNERVNAQNAVMDAIGNKVEAKIAADRVKVANEFWQRKHEAVSNKNQGQIYIHGERMGGQGVAGALHPFSAVPSHHGGQVRAKNKEEEEYLARLRQIRIQNFNERRALKERMKGNPYKVVSAESQEDKLRREKVEALRAQAEERARLVRENVAVRKQELDMKALEDKNKIKQVLEEKARARGVVPPDERPVSYNPNPIGITQALKAVGVEQASVTPSHHNQPHEDKEEPAPTVVVKPDLRKNILKRINEKFMANEKDETEKKEDIPSEPAVKQAWGAKDKELPKGQPQWAAGDIGLKLAAMPLEETASQMEATNYNDMALMNQAKDIVAKRGWNLPSNTVVNKLNQMSIRDPTLTVTEEDSSEQVPDKTVTENVNNNNALPTMTKSNEPVQKPSTGARPLPPLPARSQSPVRFTVKFEQAKRAKPVAIDNRPKEEPDAPSVTPANKGTVVLGDMSAATLDETPEIVHPGIKEQQPPKRSVVAALAAKFNAGAAKGTFVVKEKNEENILEMPSADAKGKGTALKQIEKTNESIRDDSNEEIQEISLTSENTIVTSKTPGTAHQAWSKDSETKSGDKPQVPVKPPALTPKPDSPTKRQDSNTPKTPTGSPAKPSLSPAIESSPKSPSAERLFVKVSQPPVTPSTLPISSENATPRSVEKLSKTMYTTANEEMVLKITLGHFDSPNPKLLRTCSMPDLLKPIAEESENGSSIDVSPLRRSFDDGKAKTPRSESPSSPPPTPEALDLAASVTSSMNDTNFDDGDEMVIPPGSSMDDVGEEEEDEDLASLRANLQNVLLEDDEFSSDDEREIDEKGPEDDVGWESDDQSSSSSSNSDTEDVSDTESVFSRLEANRVQLEAELGFEQFMKVYKYIQAIHEDEEEEIKEGESKIRAILGERHDRLYPRILQLVMADGAYCEDNN